MTSAFIGVVGSRNKRATFEKNLKSLGYSDDEIARVHMPVGIPLGSNTPADIAVSILAQMVAVRSNAEESSAPSLTSPKSPLKIEGG